MQNLLVHILLLLLPRAAFDGKVVEVAFKVTSMTFTTKKSNHFELSFFGS